MTGDGARQNGESEYSEYSKCLAGLVLLHSVWFEEV